MNRSYDDIILDAMNHAYRSWYPLRETTTSKGTDNSLESGFLTGLVGLLRRYAGAKLVLAWDGRPASQLAVQPDYKGTRSAKHKSINRPADWHSRCDRLRMALSPIFATLYDPEDEADVEIARYKKAQQSKATLLVSTDRDLLMLLDDNVAVGRPGQGVGLYDAESFVAEFGFSPDCLPIYKSLTGDASDNVKGIARFPTRLAKNLAAEFGSVDQLYEALHSGSSPVLAKLTKGQRDKLLAGEALVRDNDRLVNLLAATGEPHITTPKDDWGPLKKLAEELELENIVAGLEWELQLTPFSVNGHTDKRVPLTCNGSSTHSEYTHTQIESDSCSNDRTDKATARANTKQDLTLAPGWAERLAAAQKAKARSSEHVRIVPMAKSRFAGALTIVDDAAGAVSLVNLAKQLSLVCVGIDFEFNHDRPGVLVKHDSHGDHYWYDPRSIAPMLMAVTLVERTPDGTMSLYRFVVDVRKKEVVEPLGDLLRLPVVFVAHFAQAELFCIWQLGLPTPEMLWDSWVAERAFLLGYHHARYVKAKPESELEEASLKEEARDDVDFSCKLISVCSRRQVSHAFASDKERLQKSFLDHPLDNAFSQEQIDYSSADAESVSRLYPVQVQVAVGLGCLNHLVNLEMPWTITNARMAWDGVRVDPKQCQQLQASCNRLIPKLYGELEETGISNVNSHPQLHGFFSRVGLLECFRVGGKHTFDDDHLEAAQDRHPAIATIRELKKIIRLKSDKVLSNELVGKDGRLHPEHQQLGAETTRNTMRWPNIGGVGKVLRPLVVPEPGYLIGEVDLSQIEVGIAAAVFNDPELIRMFNGSDVYTAMVRQYYRDSMAPGDIDLPDKDLKKKYKGFRDRMKVFTLGTIYNITPYGLANRLGITKTRAQEEQSQFLAMFPRLAQTLQEASRIGAIRGYAYLCSGLRRWRAHKGKPTAWETNWIRNTPVQGSAGVVFKAAGNRLRLRYQHYGARLILPMHDAFVFETPRQHLHTIAKITAEVMRSTVQEYFPVLNPQVDINISHPECWNKDGKHRSLRLWMVKPELARA